MRGSAGADRHADPGRPGAGAQRQAEAQAEKAEGGARRAEDGSGAPRRRPQDRGEGAPADEQGPGGGTQAEAEGHRRPAEDQGRRTQSREEAKPMNAPVGITQLEIDQRVFDLYDEYCHGGIDRREFLKRAALIAGGLAMAQALLPRYVQAETISFTDPRMKAEYVHYPSPGGNSGTMRGYLAVPAGKGPFPAVLVIHENRGLNPYIEDVARRCAVEGYLALAPDGLSPVGGYPGNDDDGRQLQASLDQAKLRVDMLNGARYVQAHKASTGKLGVTGFCWGGGATNFLAAELGSAVHAAAP